MLDVALKVHLRLFTVGRRRQRDDTKNARAYSFGNGLDRPALAGGIAALEQDDDPQPFFFHPILHVAKLDLKLAQLLFVELALHLSIVRAVVLGHSDQLPKMTRRKRLIAKKK